MHHGVIHRQAKQNGGEAHADDIDRAENQAAERKGARQISASNVSSQSIGFKRRWASQKKKAMINGRAADRQLDVVFHAAGNFRDECGPAGVTDIDLFDPPAARRCEVAFTALNQPVHSR